MTIKIIVIGQLKYFMFRYVISTEFSNINAIAVRNEYFMVNVLSEIDSKYIYQLSHY
jgi:hypothetical protein